MPDPRNRDSLLRLSEPPVSPTPNCCNCGRFVSVESAGRHVERGDYGTVYSVEFECPRGKGCNA